MAAAPKKSADLSTYAGRFAARLRALREKAGKSVETVVAELRDAGHPTAARTYYNWELAQTTPPLNVFPALAAALQLKSSRQLLPDE